MEEKQQINDEYIISLFFTSVTMPHRIRKSTNKIIENNNDIKNYLLTRFKDSNNCSYKEILHRIKYNIEEKPKCPICGKYVKYYGLSNMLYGKTCSRKCQYEYMKTDEFQNKIDHSYMKDPDIIKIIQDKRKLKIDEIREKTKQTLFKRYGDSHYNNRIKCKQTLLEKYGVENIMQLDFVKDKIKETNLKRYGVEWSAQNKDINQKTIDTQIKKYGGVFNPEKVKKTNIERYGVEIPFMLSEIQNKGINTKLKNHTWTTSKPEKISEFLLKEKFGEDNVYCQYKSDVYPYRCDFYVKTLDLYIECNFHWTHGTHKFDENNLDDIKILNEWKQKNTVFYNSAIDVWTRRDIDKFQCAINNNLNYKAFYKLDELKQYLENIL